jgi:tetratricopeptide (TPR) repeat protein
VGARAQLAFARLKDGANADAAALIADAVPAAGAPEMAYVIAWVRFRAGDVAGAAAAIQLAASGWTDAAFKTPLLRDYLVMTARGGVPAAAAAAAIEMLFPARNLRYAFTYQLSKAYGLAGRPDEAAAAIDLAIAIVGDTVQPTDLAVYRVEQADYARQGNRVEALAPALAAAKAAFEACRDCADRDKKALGDYVGQRATEAHAIFARTGDVRYQRAATALYELFASLPPRDDSAQLAQQARDLQATTAPDDGRQYADALVPPLSARQQEAQACYEQVLQGDPALAGAVTVALEIDRSGAVIGAAGDPPAGDAGLAAVSRCIETRARAWSMPSRPRDGVARVTLAFALTPAP